jgi:hypothetical protein
MTLTRRLAVFPEPRTAQGAAERLEPNTFLDVRPPDAGAARADHTTAPPPSVAGRTAGPDHPSRARTAPIGRENSAAPRVSVVIPTYNEARRLPAVLGRVPEDVHEVIVVDGHSIDGTVEVARASRAGVRVVLQNRFGKGNALMCGFAAATGDVVVMLDADGSVDPRDIPRFVSALVEGADFVRGFSATSATSAGTDGQLHLSEPGARPWLDRLVGVLFGVAWSKLHYNCGALWREHLDRLGLPGRSNDAPVLSWGDGVEIEPIISMRAMRAGMVITEIPSQPYVQDRSAALPRTWHDRVRTAGAVCIERLRAIPRPRRRAAP